jgi:uncharacterized protein YneF (UPF0154 family)
MMPIWVSIIFLVLFIGAYIWERLAFKQLQQEYEIVAGYLDMYISKYGPLPGIVQIGEIDDAGNEK